MSNENIFVVWGHTNNNICQTVRDSARYDYDLLYTLYLYNVWITHEPWLLGYLVSIGNTTKTKDIEGKQSFHFSFLLFLVIWLIFFLFLFIAISMEICIEKFSMELLKISKSFLAQHGKAESLFSDCFISIRSAEFVYLIKHILFSFFSN